VPDVGCVLSRENRRAGAQARDKVPDVGGVVQGEQEGRGTGQTH